MQLVFGVSFIGRAKKLGINTINPSLGGWVFRGSLKIGVEVLESAKLNCFLWISLEREVFFTPSL